jgi:AraC-like DNA-binding protein
MMQPAAIDPLVLTLSAAAAGQALLCAAILIASAERDAPRDWLAALFAGLAVLAVAPGVAELAPGLAPVWMGLVLAALYALPAGFHRYAVQLTRASGDAAPLRRIHLVAPGLGLFGALLIWALPEASRRALFLLGEAPDAPAALAAIVLFILVIAWSAVSGAYVWIILRRLRGYRRRLRDAFSNTERRELYWLSGIVLAVLAVWALAAGLLLWDNLVGGFIIPTWLGPAMASTLVMALALRGLSQRPGFADMAPDEAPPPTKYEKSALDSEHAARIAERLDAAMRAERLYLDPGLSLNKLAKHVATPPNLVSQTLNQVLEATFFDYVNRWRIEAALPRIAEGRETVLAIALDVGFNTRSTFYTAFKGVTGKTPRAWREAAE